MLAETISAELSRAIAHGIAAGAHVGRKMPLDVILDAVDAYTAQEPKSAPELADAMAALAVRFGDATEDDEIEGHVTGSLYMALRAEVLHAAAAEIRRILEGK